ncbi:MAG TPA: zinc-dependent alcohol dehydrogenase family protein [Nitrococcus sp.]|nr:zinc-dependent alcohol dehydrogenase family protein [Nitrococcus sp.]
MSKASMRAMVFEGAKPRLQLSQLARPMPEPGQVQLRVRACAVCRTDLHVIDGELPHPKLPLIPGHEIIGVVEQVGEGVTRFRSGDRVGVPWLGWTCGQCRYCRCGQENLCQAAKFTGYTLDGGYAEYTIADERYCFAIAAGYDDTAAAPLLCAGLIGYRAYQMIGAGVQRLGLYGFGAAAHILTQVAVYQGKEVFAFVRPGDTAAQQFALRLGAVWAGDSDTAPPRGLDAAIIFAPVGELVPKALAHTVPGGSIVCGGIHMSDIPSFPYSLLWQERVVRSVANLTRADGEALLALAPRVPIRTQIRAFPLAQANEALDCLRGGYLQGAAVLTMA